MKPDQKKDFAGLLLKTFLVFDKEPDPRAMDTWWEMLERYRAGDVEEAFRRYLENGKFAPRPADIIAILKTFAKKGASDGFNTSPLQNHSEKIKTPQELNLLGQRPQLSKVGKAALDKIKKSDFFNRKI